ncbi:MAG: glycosyltransferase family 2 protein [Leptolyngbyaceae cyanobacterium bins.59]|nr:glycosyltransferase family 2 protein [Leptolyngbyaceae cyanobacterium bins.59]
MFPLIYWLTLSSSFVLLVPSLVLLVEALAAQFSQSPTQNSDTQRPRLAVLIPAHNEELEIQQTLLGVLPELEAGDRLIVIADNCTDTTATVARSTGATVIERQDPARRGKGYALDYGLQFLQADPPEIVVFVDADCQVQPGTIAQLAQQARQFSTPVQSIYLMETPAHPSPKDRVSAFAFKVKNWVRPLGLWRLGLPCLLTGTGIAIPWAIVHQVHWATGNIVEDMALGLDFALAGYPPHLSPNSLVWGRLPRREEAARTQRTRWEQGHLQTLATYGPKLLTAALARRQPMLLAIALDLCVPPLSFLVMLVAGFACVATAVGTLGISWVPATTMGLAGGCLAGGILLAWNRFGRSDLPLKDLLAVPLYILWKIPLYFKLLVKPQRTWVRTERG